MADRLAAHQSWHLKSHFPVCLHTQAVGDLYADLMEGLKLWLFEVTNRIAVERAFRITFRWYAVAYEGQSRRAQRNQLVGVDWNIARIHAGECRLGRPILDEPSGHPLVFSASQVLYRLAKMAAKRRCPALSGDPQTWREISTNPQCPTPEKRAKGVIPAQAGIHVVD